MKILAVSDMHGELGHVRSLVDRIAPDIVLCGGDWGDPGEVSREDYDWIIDRATVLSVFGNHDDIELLSSLVNRDGSPVLLANGHITTVGGISIAGISGIWAKSHAKPWYITDEEVAAFAEEIGSVDILMTHGCAVGLVDTFPSGKHGGNRCFLDAFKRIKPRVHLCGHLHVRHIRSFSDGTTAINIGESRNGDYALIEVEGGEWTLQAQNRLLS